MHDRDAPAVAIDHLEIDVTILPPSSAHAAAVREWAALARVPFRPSPPETPSDLEGRMVVFDLTGQGAPPTRLGSRAIAISDQRDIECYDLVPPAEVADRLPRALARLHERERLAGRVRMESETVSILNEIGYALSAHTRREDLLDALLVQARRVLRADSGSIYLVEGDKVRFVCAQNDTIDFDEAAEFVLPKDETSLAGFVACRGETLNIPDAYDIAPDAPYRINFSFDDKTGYRTRSYLLVPMRDRGGEVIGVLSLINHKHRAGVPLASYDEVQPFTPRHGKLAQSIASQAAMAIENYRLYAEIRELFDGFVEAAVTAIEARDPSTGGHSHRVSALTVALAQAVDESGAFEGITFSARDLTELHYAAILHDFGKVGVREQVLLKGNKLYAWEMDQVEARFRIAALEAALTTQRGALSGDRLRAELTQLERDLGMVRELNRPTRRTEADAEVLDRIAKRWRLIEEGEPVLMRDHVRRLCIPRGSLDEQERQEIERHVSFTHSFLQRIPWTRDLRRVPDIAYAHHEKLDGSGYPRGLAGAAIPFGARLMTISDIFDALTAGDRPYKSRIPIETALDILRDEARAGRLELDAVELFVARRLWDGIVRP